MSRIKITDDSRDKRDNVWDQLVKYADRQLQQEWADNGQIEYNQAGVTATGDEPIHDDHPTEQRQRTWQWSCRQDSTWTWAVAQGDDDNNDDCGMTGDAVGVK